MREKEKKYAFKDWFLVDRKKKKHLFLVGQRERGRIKKKDRVHKKKETETERREREKKERERERERERTSLLAALLAFFFSLSLFSVSELKLSRH